MFATNQRITPDLTAPFKQNAQWENESTPTTRAIGSGVTDGDWVDVISITGWRRIRPSVKFKMTAPAGSGSITWDTRVSSGGVSMDVRTGDSISAGGDSGNLELYHVQGEAADRLQSSDILLQNPKIQVKVTANTMDVTSTFSVEEFYRVPVAGT